MGNALSIDSETAKAWKKAADKTAREKDDAERWAKIVNEEREAASKALGEKLKKLKKEEEDKKKKKKEEEAKMKKKGEEERKKEERRRKATETWITTRTIDEQTHATVFPGMSRVAVYAILSLEEEALKG